MIVAQEIAGYGLDMSESSVSIIPMRREHVGAIVHVHQVSFQDAFGTFLGSRVLRLLYSEIIDTPDNLAFVAQDESGTLVGFVVGITRQINFYARLAQRRRFAFAAAALGAAIRHPRIIPRLFRTLGYARTNRTPVAEGLLMTIAVAPQVQHCGIGRRLVSVFLISMKQKGVASVSLTTDRDANELVNRFYQQLGFRIARAHATLEGRWMNEYVIDLSGWSPPSHA